MIMWNGVSSFLVRYSVETLFFYFHQSVGNHKDVTGQIRGRDLFLYLQENSLLRSDELSSAPTDVFVVDGSEIYDARKFVCVKLPSGHVLWSAEKR